MLCTGCSRLLGVHSLPFYWFSIAHNGFWDHNALFYSQSSAVKDAIFLNWFISFSLWDMCAFLTDFCFSSQISLSWLEFWRALVELCSVSIIYHIVSGPFFSFYSFYLREQYFLGEFQLIASVINREPDSIACLLTWFVFSTEISH